ncbi:MAG: carboxypeptidase-like regulatory domain-containing protein [Melioribacteraceae bacterium]|nr:carboxypeptidase-like regulatory domain-containing protein [Melioribacteraceae bacterium]
MILDSQKVNVKNVKVFLNSDSAYTNSEGLFIFNDVPNGEYQITFLFDFSSHPFIRNRTISIISNQENKTEEYLVYQEAVFKGKVYTEIDNERINIENAKIYFLGDTTTTDIDGKFSFNYEFSLYEGRNIRFNIIYNENYFDGNETILIENTYHYNEYYLSPKISLKLEIFSIKESEKLVLNEASVRLNGEILKQDDVRYYKNDIKYGYY